MGTPLRQLLHGMGLLIFLFGTSVPGGDEKEFGGFSWEFTPLTDKSSFEDIFDRKLSEAKESVKKEQDTLHEETQFSGDSKPEERKKHKAGSLPIAPRNAVPFVTFPTDPEILNWQGDFRPIFERVRPWLLRIVSGRGLVEARIKSLLSIKRKLMQKKMENPSYSLRDMPDIVGFRITCQTVRELRIMQEMLRNEGSFPLMETICFGVCPGQGKYAADGYRRIHLVFVVGGRKIEVQLSTPYMNKWADWNQTIRKRNLLLTNPDVERYALNLAEYFLRLDEIRDLTPPCPHILSSLNVEELIDLEEGLKIGEEDFGKMGRPPNGCLWWNDYFMDKALILPHNQASPQFGRKGVQ